MSSPVRRRGRMKQLRDPGSGSLVASTVRSTTLNAIMRLVIDSLRTPYQDSYRIMYLSIYDGDIPARIRRSSLTLLAPVLYPNPTRSVRGPYEALGHLVSRFLLTDGPATTTSPSDGSSARSVALRTTRAARLVAAALPTLTLGLRLVLFGSVIDRWHTGELHETTSAMARLLE